MTDKREARRQRAEQDRLEREQGERQRKFRSRLLVVVAILAMLTVGVLSVTRRNDENAGRVWSPEHGHWHDK